MDKLQTSRFSTLRADLRELLTFFAPIFFEQLCISICSIITSSTLAGLGSAEVSAFNLVDTLNVFLLQVFLSMGTGAAVVVSQYRGKRDPVGAGRVAVQSIWFLTGISLSLFALILIFNRPLLVFLLGAADEAIFVNGRTFLLTSAFSIPFFMLYNVSANIIRGSGYPRRTMLLSILTNALYALFSWLFVQLGLGMLSPGLALIIARAYGAVHGLLLVRRGNEHLYVPTLRIKKLDFSVVRTVLFIGIPMSIENLIFQGGRLLTQTFVIPFGTDSLAANSIANNMANLLLVPGSAFQLTLVPIVGKFIGMDDKDRARSVTRTGVLLSSLMHVVTCTACYFLMTPFLALYSQPEPVNDIIRVIFRYYLIAMPLLWSVSFVLPNALRGAGDVRVNMYGSIASMIVFRLLVSFCLTHFTNLGVHGIWFGMYIDWIARSTFFLVRFHGHAWTEKKLV